MQRRQHISILGILTVAILIAGAIVLLLLLRTPSSDDEIPIPTIRPTEIVSLPTNTATFTLLPPTDTPAPTITPTASPSRLPPSITPSPQPTIIPETPIPALPPLPAPVEIALGVPVFGGSGIPPTYGRYGGLYDNEMLINAGHVMINVPGSGDIPSFYIDTFEVTNLQLVNFLNATLITETPLTGYNPSARWVDATQPDAPLVQNEAGIWMVRNPRLEMLPARYISALTARAYCNNIDAALPTLEQWRLAAFQAPDAENGMRPFPWGDIFPDNTYAIFATEEAQARDTLERGRSWIGAFHMAGNVAEWVRVDDTQFGIIGGSFLDSALGFAEAVQNVQIIDGSLALPNAGFRCVRSG